MNTIIANAFSGCNNIETLYFNAENCIECGQYNCSAFPESLKELKIGNSVKNIPAYAFRYCNELRSVTIPNSVSFIGEEAFLGCSNITSVITHSLASWINIDFKSETSNPTYYAKNLFVENEIIRKLTIPEGIKYLNSYSFINCEGLVMVDLPASLEASGSRIFSGCTGLQRIVFPHETSLLSMGYINQSCHLNYENNAKYYIGLNLYNPVELTIPEDMTTIPDYAFYGWSNLRTVKIGNKVKSIGSSSFENCNSLTSVSIPPSITTIGSNAFYGCHNLISTVTTSLDSWLKIEFKDIYANPTYYAKRLIVEDDELRQLIIPEGHKSINSFAFVNCNRLVSIKIPSSITSIEASAFSGCTDLNSVRISDVNNWARVRFGDCYANPLFYAHNLCVGNSYEAIKNLVIEGEKPICNFAFYGASCLERARIKDGAMMEENSFYGCSNLKDICINSEQIPENAFISCSKIENIYIPLETPPDANNNTFSNYEGVNLYVPVGCIANYEKAENCWWHFLDIFESDFNNLDTIFAPDYSKEESGIEWLEKDGNSCISNDILNIYNLQGVCLKNNATKDYIKSLASGIYIIDGKKVIVKN